MRTNKLKLFVTAVVTATVAITSVSANADASEVKTENKAVYTVNSEKENSTVQFLIDVNSDKKLPKNFRTTKDDISGKDTENINLTGLADLNMSGSGALSENGLKLIKEETKGYNLVDVDLRKESHGVVDGYAVSWYGENNHANIDLTEKEVLKDEKTKFHDIKKAGYAKFDYNAKKSGSDITELDNVKTAEPESKMAESLDVRYLRIMVSDHLRPANDDVDKFVKKIKKLSKKKNTWFHFHCRGGVGRTTTFMAMYDMMNNAKNVSYFDILKRQALIGGSDLIEGNSEDKENPENSRAEFLKDFYDYCVNNDDNFETSFSEYMEDR
ncbi:MAG: protein-tyrosine phosphatase family protein [Clostridium sp.]